MRGILAVGIVILLLTGCDQPKLDTTNENTLQQSMAKVRAALPDENQRKQFDSSVQLIISAHLSLDDLIQAGMAGDSEQAIYQASRQLNGKTAEQILREAEQLKIKLSEDAKKSALAQIKLLSQKKLQAETDKEILSLFEITHTRLHLNNKVAHLTQPIVTFNVKNNTGKMISSAAFICDVMDETDNKLLYHETLFYKHPTALTSKNEEEWRLHLGVWSESQSQHSHSLKANITLVRLIDNHNNVIYDSERFSEAEQLRLIELQKDYTQ